MPATRFIRAFTIAAALKHARGRPIQAPAGLIGELLEQIGPRHGCESACRDMVRKHIAIIKSIKEVGDVDQSTTIKAELEKFIYVLKKIRGVLSQLSPVTRHLIFDDPNYEFFSNELADLIEEVEITYSLIPAKKGSKPQLRSKMVAAGFARYLMENYSSFSPTLTKGGRFFRVAGLLYEAATRERADLTRYCRLLAH